STPTIITTPTKVVIYIYDGLFRVISPTGISAFVIIDVLLNYCCAINIGTAIAIDIRENFICLSIFHCLIYGLRLIAKIAFIITDPNRIRNILITAFVL